MNELDQFTRFRAEVPLRVSPHAEDLFRTALAANQESQRTWFSRHLPPLRPPGPRPRWRIALVIPAVAGVLAALLVAVLPSSGQPVLTAQLLADRAASAALDQPAVPAGQWVYVQQKWYNPYRTSGPTTFVNSGWATADGRMSYGYAGTFGAPAYPYSKLGSLPSDPAQLDAYLVSLDPVKTDDSSLVAFSRIRSMLFDMVLPPSLQAEMYHALALIHNVQVRQHVTDIADRDGVAFLLPQTKQSEQLEIILDTSDYHLLAQASWTNPSRPAPDSEVAILKRYPVAEPGSTQPTSTPPSPAELAAEQIYYTETREFDPSNIGKVTPGQWLYRDLSTGGKDQKVWATADDSAQATDVSGTLQVCKRTEPCAASTHWLMPAGPSFSLVHPPAYPTPTLPPYPRQLLDKLNGYSTGCTDVANDCNAVNVVVNMLTGYGNYPYFDATWLLALADVPGVSVQHVTDAAGNDDLAFTFPAQDGVTAILVNATLLSKGTIQYQGYVRDGQQTLVQNQSLVSGPGVLPAG